MKMEVKSGEIAESNFYSLASSFGGGFAFTLKLLLHIPAERRTWKLRDIELKEEISAAGSLSLKRARKKKNKQKYPKCMKET